MLGPAEVLNRRHLLVTAAALAGSAAAPALAQPAPAGTPQAQLDALLETFFQEALDDSPELATQLGVDKGVRATAKAQLDDRSIAELERDKAQLESQLRRLKAIPRAPLTGMAAVNYDAVLDGLERSDAANKRFAYGNGGAGQPYVLSQLTGAYRSIPDFLGTQHTIETKADADAYLARLEAYATVMDQEAERARRDVGLGVVPPDFVIERSLQQMRALKVAPQTSPLVTSVANRAREKRIAGDYAAQAAKIYSSKVVPALDRQIAFMEGLKPRAVHDAGVWRLPDGEAYYAHASQASTTTRMTPDEIHQMGLDESRRLSDRAEVLLRKLGMTQGTVGQRIRALYDDPKHHYPNTDPAKEKLIEDLNAQVKAMMARLPEVFGRLPKAPVEVRRVPTFIEAGAPGGYYNQPTLDGSRPGIYWINLRDTAEYPKWTLPTLTYHEAVPGHHMHLAIQQETELPMIRRATFLSAYGEGWALYAEELAREMGVYEDDPLGEIGYLQSSLFRSARLVVDTGLHAKRWSREKAIETMTSIDGSPTSAATTEIERYCVWPGQACSYMVGKLTWLRLREAAKAKMGARFDLRAFHDMALASGSVPLTVLERRVADWSEGGAV
ncbi:DUF885 domain-containing protein [Phenylobacterium sp.]|jgi:uncharacterized protein (DUF885 family)|uniref:DUF885 domain-containing protein n=1 Tax=Phenylobacterium sp. TaxID=1871053 RepID=UPI002E34DC04|nr:DUF885 family protein [Phenylobacterium sp.]HEX2561771.1 DUF885 family protein [Phenylobacterium sp.]